jgi:hypothetical protein
VHETTGDVGRECRRDAQPSSHRASTGAGALRRAESSIIIELA